MARRYVELAANLPAKPRANLAAKISGQPRGQYERSAPAAGSFLEGNRCPHPLLELLRKSRLLDDDRLPPQVENLRVTGQLSASQPARIAGQLVQDGTLTPFQAEQLLQGNWRGFFICQYKVLQLLGSGTTCRVYLCQHVQYRRCVAAKILLPAVVAQDQRALARFYREARATAAVDHANVVHAYDINQDGHYHFLIMELVDGSTLKHIVRKTGPLEAGRAAHYLRQAATGLQHVHEMGLVHRDIEPSNILTDRAGVVKIADFGLARFYQDVDDRVTLDGEVLGTPDYMAPEQSLDSHSVDSRADIYGLGATFYFCLTGQPPFPEGTIAQKLIWHHSRVPSPIASYRNDMPDGLAAVVARMMAKNPAERYQSAAEVADALAPWTQTPVPPPTQDEMPAFSWPFTSS